MALVLYAAHSRLSFDAILFIAINLSLSWVNQKSHAVLARSLLLVEIKGQNHFQFAVLHCNMIICFPEISLLSDLIAWIRNLQPHLDSRCRTTMISKLCGLNPVDLGRIDLGTYSISYNDPIILVRDGHKPSRDFSVSGLENMRAF